MPKEVRDLVITGCEEITHGKSASGVPWTLWKVKANRADTGAAIELPLRSFVELARGERGEYTVEKNESDQHGVTYTLTPKRESLRVQKQRIDRLEERMEELEEQVVTLTNALLKAGAPIPTTGVPE